VCDRCGSRFPVDGLTDDDYRTLRDWHSYNSCAAELRMLLKVREFYRRHPDAEGSIKPHFLRVLESDDPGVQAQQDSGVPFDQIVLPPADLPAALVLSTEDAEVVEYLQHYSCTLDPRMQFVSEAMDRLAGSQRVVLCPHCREGCLHVPLAEHTIFPARERDSITWLGPDWANFGDDGALHLKATGWQDTTHWTGKTIINKDMPDYDFWCWFVAQKEYHRLVEETELPAIRAEWTRRTSA
jgi:hypothetical protein